MDPYHGSLEFLKNPENRSKLMESILGEHLIRFLFTQNLTPHFNYSDHVFYWKSKKKREVDFVVRCDDIFIPIELKYQSKIRRDDLYGIFDFMKGGRSGRGIVVTKNELSEEDGYVKIPVSLFLLIM